MLALNLVTRAVIVHDGRLLLTLLSDGQRAPFHTLLGGHLDMSESLTQGVVREVREEVGLAVAPSRLLYVVENYFYRGAAKLHEIGFYFLCHPLELSDGDLLDQLTVEQGELISPELHSPAELARLDFQPAVLRDVLAADTLAGFPDCPKLIVVNELPGDVQAKPGVFKL